MTLHILAAGLWVGGLIVLALVLPGLERRDVSQTLGRFGGSPRRASPCWSPPASTARAARSTSLDALLSTTYGWSLVGKARPARRHRRARACSVCARSAACGRRSGSCGPRRSWPSASSPRPRSCLPARPPAARSSRPAPRPVTGTPLASGHAADLLVDVSAAPNRPGQNFVTATVLDTLRPSPGPVRRVTITFSRGRSRVTVPATRLDANALAGRRHAALGARRLADRGRSRARRTATCDLGDLLDRRLAARRGARAQGALLAARRSRRSLTPLALVLAALACAAAVWRVRARRIAAAAADRVMRAALLLALAGAALLPAPASAAPRP